jgi:murein DD-endopeptidase MepM/ murein hydrolase activator NlpD
MKNKIVVLVTLISVVLFSLKLVVAAPDGQSESNSKIEAEINSIDSKKKDAEKELSDSEDKAKKLNDQKGKKIEEKEKLEEESKSIDEEIAKLNTKVENAEKNYKAQETLCKKRIAIMYESANSSQVGTFLRSKTLFEFYQKAYIMSIVAKKDKELMKNLELAKKELESSKKLQQDLLDEKKDKVSQTEKDIKDIGKQGDDVQKEIESKKRAVEKYKKMLEDMEKESKNIDTYINSKTGNTSNVKYTGGKMMWPVPSSHSISSPFGYRINPISGTSELHTGLDIPAVTGSSIIAPASGTVIYSGWQNGYGYTLMIDHGGGIVTLYGHNSSLVVGNGVKVGAGQVVAKVGTTGYSTGPHSHFEVRINGKPTDPSGYVGQ